MSRLRLHRTSAGADLVALRPGVDLVLDPLYEHGALLPDGVAVDDHLDAAARAQADREAGGELAAWHEARRVAFVVDGVDLAFVWEVELLAQCFLPAARLRLALAAAGVSEVDVAAQDEDLRDLAMGAGVVVQEAPPTAAPPTGAPPRAILPPLTRLMNRAGLPANVRGDVLAMSYWNLEPVWRQLAAASRPRLVAGGARVPGLDPRTTLRTAARGGWSGFPTSKARGRSAQRLSAALDAIAVDSPRERYIVSVLRRQGGDTLAIAERWRRIVAEERLRLVVVPFDSPQESRMLLEAAHAAGVDSLLVQHGFDARLNNPDKSVAHHAALWSERDRTDIAARSSASLHVTGNPGGAHLTGKVTAHPGAGGPAVVLVEYPSRLSAAIDARIAMRHVDAALEALECELPGVDVIVRPHPSDPAPGTYLALAAGRALRVSVDTASPIEVLMARASLCVGALSTATLQAAALGVPTIFVDLTEASRPWPFDGAPDGLAVTAAPLEEGLAARATPAPEAAREALGVRPDAVRRVTDLIRSLAVAT